MYHRQAHINATKMPITTLPVVVAVVNESVIFTPKYVDCENDSAVATSKAPSGLRLPRAMYGMAEST